eukprot:COSAG05_NODE_2091_length_3578_cov_2.905145_2_plen_67_part_00
MTCAGSADMARLFVSGWPSHLGCDAVVKKLRSFGRVDGPVLVTRKGDGALSCLLARSLPAPLPLRD